MIRKTRCIGPTLLMVAALLFNSNHFVELSAMHAAAQAEDTETNSAFEQNRMPASWIMKWETTPSAEFMNESEVLREIPQFQVMVVRSKAGIDPQEWRDRWSKASGVVYLHPNQQVQLHAAPNDPHYKYQSHLQQIGAPNAWDIASENTDITIAFIDTGVDLEHPDLKPNLVEGTNLIDPQVPPMDDHGHGTNVAGVIAAAGNNQAGVTGVIWRAKIMPIKALEQSGLGEEDKLGEGIRYAVDHGAKIVVLAVGLHRYSPFLQEVVEYAEQKGVLLVSASGNEGKQVKYPAAFPTVLAVGGVNANNRVTPDSNFGPELDLVAPWEVYTTALGSRYGFNQGTSMAAPQAAGAAALIWAKYPEMKPYEIRNLLRQTAQDIGEPGWDPKSGYGLLRMDRALTEPYLPDWYEPNDKREHAKRLPIDSIVYGELTGGSDADWFYFDPDYRGKVTLHMAAAGGSPARLPVVNAVYYPSDGSKETIYADILKTPAAFRLPAGRGYVRLQMADERASAAFRYKLSAHFEIYKDDFEDNDKQYKAYTLPELQGSIKGTFHQLNDQDWFSLHVTETGSLSISLTPDSMRIDAAFMVQKSGEKAFFVDNKSDGGAETLIAYDVTPGRYYILVSNVIGDEAYPVRGEYELKWQVTPKRIDPNEPNDKSYQATKMVLNTEYEGLIDQTTDTDWFTFTVPAESYVQVRLSHIPEDRLMLMTLFDGQQTQIALNINSQTQNRLELNQVLGRGTYYIKLAANKPFTHQLYRLHVQADELLAGLRDISGHWAEDMIVALKLDGDVNGYPDYTFRPDAPITRAEAVAMLVKAHGLAREDASMLDEPIFLDVPLQHWAFGVISQAVSAGMVSGYADGTFRPDQPITRAEMAAMAARGAGWKAAEMSRQAFNDMPDTHWAAGWAKTLADRKLISGYPDGTFRPDKTATRAEMVSIVVRLKNRQ